MEIKVCEKNKEKIMLAIAIAEGRSTERKLTYDLLLWGVRKIEEQVDIPKKHMDGISATVNPHAHEFPQAYKYTPMATKCKLTNTKGSWYFAGASRENCNSTYCIVIKLTEAAKAAILDRIAWIK